MAQYQVPQFIETEDKIVGPFTLRQFLYIAVAGLISFMLFFVFKLFVWLIFTALISSIAAAFAFVKYNGRPLTTMLFSAFKYLWHPRLYLWKSQAAQVRKEDLTPATPPTPKAPEEKESPLSQVMLKLRTSLPFTRTTKPKKEEIAFAAPASSSLPQAKRRVDYRQ